MQFRKGNVRELTKSSADEAPERITNAHYLTQGYVSFQAAVQSRSEAGGPCENVIMWSAAVRYSHVT